MHKETIEKILNNTSRNYNLIAVDYTRTRQNVTPDIRGLLDEIKKGDKVLDSGCANARMCPIIEEKGAQYFGIDKSSSLIDIAKNFCPRGDFSTGDALDMSYKDGFFDKVYSISVMHHIPSRELRIKYLKEIQRVLKKDGKIYFRVWDIMQDKWKLILKYILLRLIGKSELDFFDIYIPWKDGGGNMIAKRYIHCFRKNELKELFKEAGFEVTDVYRDRKGKMVANIYVIGRKKEAL